MIGQIIASFLGTTLSVALIAGGAELFDRYKAEKRYKAAHPNTSKR